MRIATLGDINIDVVLTVDHLPGPGEEVFSTRRREILGGSAVNTGVVLSRLGHGVAVMGCVGVDEPGQRALSQLESFGVSTDLTTKSEAHPTAMNTVMVTPNGERTMIGARGANVDYVNPQLWETGIEWLHVSGYALMDGTQRDSAIEAIDKAGELEIPISLDVPSGVGGRIRQTIGDRLNKFRIVAGGRVSLREATGVSNPPLHLVDAGVKRVAMTSGADPFVLTDGMSTVQLAPPKVDPVDATGAGDALIAGLIASELAEFGLGPSAVLGAAAGAAATLVSGASQTLADSTTWKYLLDPGLWKDAEPEWLDSVSTMVSGR